jgi:cytochrome c
MYTSKYMAVLPALLLLLFLTTGNACKHHSPEKPEENRFEKTVLVRELDEPLQFEILANGRILLAERKGKIKMYDPGSGQVSTIAQIPVRHTFNGISAGGTDESEDGIQGVLLDPDYEKNHYIYVYYAPLEGTPRNLLVRFKWDGGSLNLSTQKILLEIPVDADVCCHVGGGMVFDKHGNLFLSTGENAQTPDGFSTIDERPGHITSDSQKSSANTNDLRGKILRIHPEPDGSYSIPKGNLFPPGTPHTRPEIYTMGNRNPWRLSIDSKTGWLYWGEVGPNGGVDDTLRGPRSYDEFNQAKAPGNYGYPYFIGNNKAYRKYDFATGISREKFNAAHPENHSPNNTGMTNLPAAQPAFVWYPYAVSDEFPLLGSGGCSAVGGPVYRRADFSKTARAFPRYYEGKWFVTDWVRGWIMAITMDEKGNYQSMERFLPGLTLKGPIDMDFGPDGDLYIMEYGNGVFKGNPDAQIIKITYNAGNRSPIVQASANKTAGAVPFDVQLSANGTKDDDNDKLTYEWKVTRHGQPDRLFTKPAPLVTFDDPGLYTAVLTVSDPHGGKNSDTVEISAGNEPPVINFDFKGSNKSFFFQDSDIHYAVKVSDQEDGSLENKGINPRQVAVNIDYVPEGYDLSGIKKSQKGVDVSIQFANELIDNSDCKSCHNTNTASRGPSFTDIAKKYAGDETARDRLAKKVISGGSGSWGDAMMPPHPAMPENNARAISKYILGLGQQKRAATQWGVTGNYPAKIPAGESEKGSFVFKAGYTDKGTPTAPPQTAVDLLVLRNPVVPVMHADHLHEVEVNRHIFYDLSDITPNVPGAFLEFNKIDFTGIKAIAFGTVASPKTDAGSGWSIEIRIDSTTGRMIGQIPVGLPAKNSAGNNAARLKTSIDTINGVHDVYFIFKITQTENTKERIKIRDVEFLPGA